MHETLTGGAKELHQNNYLCPQIEFNFIKY